MIPLFFFYFFKRSETPARAAAAAAVSRTTGTAGGGDVHRRGAREESLSKKKKKKPRNTLKGWFPSLQSPQRSSWFFSQLNCSRQKVSSAAISGFFHQDNLINRLSSELISCGKEARGPGVSPPEDFAIPADSLARLIISQ